jgi:site-specific DNA-methyltransferase (adenine-specific)
VIPFAPMWEAVKYVLKPRGVFVTTASQPFTSALVMSNLEWFKHVWVWDKVLSVGHLVVKHRPMQQTEDVLVFGGGALTYNPVMSKRDRERYITKRVGQGNTVHVGHEQRDFYQNVLTERFPTNLLTFANTERQGHHPTQKPVALMAYLIRTYTNPGETVLDICMGSGTTGVACVKTGRNFIGMERDPAYFAIAEKRIAEARLQLPLLEVP